MDCSPPGSSVHGILQARILEWTGVFSSSGSSQPRDRTSVSYVSYRFYVGRFYTTSTTWAAPYYFTEQLSLCITTIEPVLQSLWAATTELVYHNYWSPDALGLASQNYWAWVLQLVKPVPRAWSTMREATAVRSSSPCSPQLDRKPKQKQWRLSAAKINKNLKKKRNTGILDNLGIVASIPSNQLQSLINAHRLRGGLLTITSTLCHTESADDTEAF